MDQLLKEIKNCQLCKNHLPFGCNPVFTAHTESKIIVIGQAPGRVVHNTGIPWNDKSGDNLRNWMGIDKSIFYDVAKISLIPMGFCYPGTGKSGDFPPKKECAPQWHQALFDYMPQVELVLLVGQYAQNYYLNKQMKTNLTETVKYYKCYLPNYFPLPHPSPRNNIWQAKNEWFKRDVLPELKQQVQSILSL